MIRVLFFFIVSSIYAYSQDPVIFIESSDELQIESKSGSLAKSLADLNGDFRDDILTAGKDSLQVEIQLNNGSKYKTVFADKMNGAAYTLNTGDFNNDGYNDFLYSGHYNGIFSYHNQQSISDFEQVQFIDADLYAQGSSLLDIDNDGWLDAVLAHDDGASQIYLNQKDGTLALDNLINFNTVPVSDNSGNYSAIWLDANGDQRQDLYISKCKNGVSDSSDPRRINTLYLNEENGFREAAAEFNIALGEQSWCADAGDLDNDGDIDMIVINHEAPHLLLENINNDSFVVHSDFADGGPLFNYDLEVAIADFNNDGLLDILISGVKDNLLLNKGGLGFTKNQNPFGFKNASSAAVGDLNDDGYLDCYISFGGPAIPSTIPDETWINFGGNNNFLKLSLSGVESNKSGIGTKVIVYSNSDTLTRWLNSGTAYGITNSLNMHFGLHQNTGVDSITINWPSGIIDHYTDLEINQHYIATEGKCISKRQEISFDNLILDCEQDSILLSATSDTDLIWSTQSNENAIHVANPGFYTVSSRDTLCLNRGPVIFVDTLKALVQPIINFSGEWELCEGDQLILELLNNASPLCWSNLLTTPVIEAHESGIYFAQSKNNCESINSDSIHVNFIANSVRDTAVTIDMPGNVSLDFGNDQFEYYADSDATNKIGEGNILVVEDLSSDSSFYYTRTRSRTIPQIQFAPIDSTSTNYGSSIINGHLEFSIHQPVVLHSITVMAEIEGVRKIIIIGGVDTIFSQEYLLNSGINKIEIKAVLDSGEYIITTDTETNIQNFGVNSPGLAIIENLENDVFPISGSSLLSIHKSSNGNASYYYFFDWQIEKHFDACVSNIGVIDITLDTTVSISETVTDQLSLLISPNPASEFLRIDCQVKMLEINIYDVSGRMVTSYKLSGHNSSVNLNISDLISGIYSVTVRSNGKSFTTKLIKG